MNTKLSTIKRYCLPGLVTFLAMVTILVFKGIWPFGSNRIDFFDNMQQVAPLYCHLWDFMHGDASIWFDWYTGLGTNVSMSISAFSMLSPFNLLLYLVPRSLILEFISVLTIVKMIVMAVSMYALIESRYKKLPYNMKVVYSVMYAFCGYVILYASCFTPWMDVVALFPLLILALDRMLETEKMLFYIAMVALIFIINYYLGAMSLVYVFFTCGIRMVTRIDKSLWRRNAWNIGIGTFAGIGLSAFVFVPVMLQLSTSQRSGAKESLLSQYKGWVSAVTFNGRYLAMLQRFTMLTGTAFLIVLILVGLKALKKTKEELGYTVGMLSLVLIPLISEGTNLMWHFGSYNGYTLRMGYVIAFALIILAAEAGERIFVNGKVPGKIYVLEGIVAAAVCAVYAVVYNHIPQNKEWIALYFFTGCFILFGLIYFLAFKKMQWHINPNALIAVIAVEVFISAYAFIGPPKFYKFEPYQHGDYVELANDAMEGLDIKESATDRIINPDLSLNANYPLILRRGAQSSFTAALLKDSQNYSVNLGYSRYFLWLLDSGGTVFSDSLFHVTEAVNQNELDSNLYTLEKEGGEMRNFKLYRANYQMPFAMYAKDSMVDKLGKNYKSFDMDWVDLQNTLYQGLVSSDDKLVTRYVGEGVDYKPAVAEARTAFTVKVKGKQALYINASTKDDMRPENEDDYQNVCRSFKSGEIFVNGTPVVIPTLGDLSNVKFANSYNNNLVFLGVFEDETVTVDIKTIKVEGYKDKDGVKRTRNFYDKNDFTIAGVDLNKLRTVCDTQKLRSMDEVSYDNSSVTVKVSGVMEDEQVLLPVIYNSDNWTVTVDGKKLDKSSLTNVSGMFTAVKVAEGEHTIVMSFKAKGCDKGLMITLAVLFLIVVFAALKKFTGFKVPAFCHNIAYWVYAVLFVAGVVLMFVIPLICSCFVMLWQVISLIFMKKQ